MIKEANLVKTTVPALATGPITINSSNSPGGLRRGETLTVVTNGELRSNFAPINATLNVSGGSVGDGLELLGSTVNVSAGIIGTDVIVHEGTTLSISGGRIGSNFVAYPNSVVNITGGRFGENFLASQGSKVTVGGGAYATFMAHSTSTQSTVALSGGAFQLNGAPISESTVTLGSDDVMAGVLADGSPFIFSYLAGDRLSNVKLEPVTVPAVNVAPQTLADHNAPNGLRDGQLLTVVEGGELGDHFTAIGGEIRLIGGQAGNWLKAMDAHVNVDGGRTGDQFHAFSCFLRQCR